MSPDNLPLGLSVADLSDDMHFVSSEDAEWERDLAKADDLENDL